MQNQPSKIDEETLAFLQQIFQLVRGGQAEEFREYLVRGLPLTCATKRATACS